MTHESTPLVSVVICTYNRSAVVLAAVGSVLSQTMPDLELVVVDDGSSDDTLEVLARVEDDRLVIVSQPNGGLSAARNTGVARATGRYVTFLDDDDEALPGALRALADALGRNPASALVHGVSIVVDDQGRQVQRLGSPYQKAMRLDCGFLTPGDFLMRRSLVERGARFDPALEILEDMEFFIQCSELTDLLFIDVPVHRYWSAAGDSGAGGAGNTDPARLRRALGYIAAKWGTGRRA